MIGINTFLIASIQTIADLNQFLSCDGKSTSYERIHHFWYIYLHFDHLQSPIEALYFFISHYIYWFSSYTSMQMETLTISCFLAQQAIKQEALFNLRTSLFLKSLAYIKSSAKNSVKVVFTLRHILTDFNSNVFPS